MEKIKMLVIQFIVKRYALGWLIQCYKFLQGYKTQLAVAGAAMAWLLEVFSIITPQEAERAYAILGGAGSVAFLAKLKPYHDMAQSIAGQVKEKSEPIEMITVGKPDEGLRG